MEQSEIDEGTAGVVNSILLMRIYDLLWLILADSNQDFAASVAEAHERGEFIGPNPSVSAQLADNSEVLREDDNEAE